VVLVAAVIRDVVVPGVPCGDGCSAPSLNRWWWQLWLSCVLRVVYERVRMRGVGVDRSLCVALGRCPLCAVDSLYWNACPRWSVQLEWGSGVVLVA